MMNFIIRAFVNAFILLLVVAVVPGIEVSRWEIVILAALILGWLNAFLKPILVILTLPLQIFSLGLFTLIINGFMILLVSKIIPGFMVVNFASAFWGALLYSILGFAANVLIDPSMKIQILSQQAKRRSGKDDDNIIDVEATVEEDKLDNKSILHD